MRGDAGSDIDLENVITRAERTIDFHRYRQPYRRRNLAGVENGCGGVDRGITTAPRSVTVDFCRLKNEWVLRVVGQR